MTVTVTDNYHTSIIMETAKLLHSSRSQAIRLPKSFRFFGEEVAIKHFGNMLISAQTLSINATLVTNNTQELEQIKGLNLENWI